MTIPHNKPTQPTPSDAVRQIVSDALDRGVTSCVVSDGERGFLTDDERDVVADEILTTLSDAGLAVLPLEATDEMWDAGQNAVAQGNAAMGIWSAMSEAFHSSQLEKTDE